jgi:hypothetical protein
LTGPESNGVSCCARHRIRHHPRRSVTTAFDRRSPLDVSGIKRATSVLIEPGRNCTCFACYVRLIRRELVTSRLDLWSRHANNSSVRRGLRQAHLPRIVYAVYQAGTLALSADSLCGLTIGRAVLKQHTEYPNEDSPPKLPIKLLRIFLLDPIGHPGPAPGLRSKEEFPLPVWRP